MKISEANRYPLGDDAERLLLQTQTEQDLIAKLLSEINIQPTDKVLDLGSGAGDITSQIAQKASSVIGVDKTPEQIIAAIQSASQRKIANVEYILGDAEHIPLPDDQFDISFSRYVFEYLNDPLKALKELIRVTKPEGQVAIHDFNGWTFRGLPKHLQRQLYAILDHVGVNYRIGSQLEDLFKQAGLTNIRVAQFQHNEVKRNAPAGIVADWESRLEKMRSAALEIFQNPEAVDDFESNMMGWIRDNRDPKNHMHTNSFLVIGTVAEKASV